MTLSFPNVLVDPDPFFEDWMTASTNSVESEEIVGIEDEDGITIVSSAATSNLGVLSSVGSVNDIAESQFTESEENQILLSGEQSHLSISSVDSEESHSHFPPHWQSHLAAGASSVLSLTTTESEYEHVEEQGADFPNRQEQEHSTHQGNGDISDLSSSASTLGQDSLSLDPSSVPSSQLSQLPSIVRRTSSSSLQSLSSSHNQMDHDQAPHWFQSIDTDQDWETWRDDMLQVLSAFTGDSTDEEDGEALFALTEAQRAGDVDPDWLLAAVLSLQPDLLTPKVEAKKSGSRKHFWAGVAAVVASAVVPVAVAMVAGTRPRVRV